MLRRVRHAIGEWRNCDVTLELLEQRRGEKGRSEGAREKMRGRRIREIEKARRRLAREDLEDVERAVREARSRCDGAVDVGRCLRLAIRGALQRWRFAVAEAVANPTVRNIHALRIATKRLRYRMELARDAGESRALSVLPWLENLQDGIGRWHDGHVRRKMTHERGGPCATRDRCESLELTEILASARAGEGRAALESWITASVPRKAHALRVRL
jgi:CHAD domain-containing protein